MAGLGRHLAQKHAVDFPSEEITARRSPSLSDVAASGSSEPCPLGLRDGFFTQIPPTRLNYK